VTPLCDRRPARVVDFAGLRHVLDHEVRTRVRALRQSVGSGITDLPRWQLCIFPTPIPKGARTITEIPDLAIG